MSSSPRAAAQTLAFLLSTIPWLAIHQAGQDYLVELQNATGTLTLDDFI